MPWLASSSFASAAALTSLVAANIIVASKGAAPIISVPVIRHPGPLSAVDDAIFWGALSGEPQTAADVAEIRANLATFGRLLINQMRRIRDEGSADGGSA